ncbi:MAG: hypothetical protein QG635_1574 [Bacteroidota bacterium]|nr:hypothetical protein [Bacteroidota bacterium]
MNNILDFLKRYGILIILAAAALAVLRPKLPELNTLALITAIEAIAVALSGLAAFAYTKIDFTKEDIRTNLGYIFLGVHICTGLTVLGVYIAQYSM